MFALRGMNNVLIMMFGTMRDLRDRQYLAVVVREYFILIAGLDEIVNSLTVTKVIVLIVFHIPLCVYIVKRPNAPELHVVAAHQPPIVYATNIYHEKILKYFQTNCHILVYANNEPTT